MSATTSTDVKCDTDGCSRTVRLDGSLTSDRALHEPLAQRHWLALGLYSGKTVTLCTMHTWALLALLGHVREGATTEAKGSDAEFRDAVTSVLGTRPAASESPFSGLFGGAR